MSKTTSGFTAVEIIVVIVIIGIITSVIGLSMGSVQAKARDTQRSSRTKAIVEALEDYYSKNGEYPSCTAMSQSASTITTNTLTSLDPSNLAAPTAASGTTNSILNNCTDLTTSADSFAYVGSNCTAGGCLQYTFKYRNEGSGSAVSLTSRHFVLSIPITAIDAITGTATVGSVLTAGALTPSSATVTYQWQSATTSGGTYTNISGATASTYALVIGDLGKYIKVVATATGIYTGTQTSAALNVGLPPITAIAAITGTTTIGSTLTAGALTPSGATATYQWQSATTSGGTYTNISGATASTYIVSPSIMNKYLKVVATANGSYSGTVTSAATSSAVATDANWLAVGTQTWAKYNLNVGTMVTGVTAQTNNAVLEKYCYNNLESNCTLNNNGGLYQWDEAMQYVTTEGSKGICPAGSHIPSDNDIKILEMQLGMTQAQADATSSRGTNQGTQLKTGGSSGLNIPIAGLRQTDGSFNYLSSFTYLLSSSQLSTRAWSRTLCLNCADISRLSNDKVEGASVRCLGN